MMRSIEEAEDAVQETMIKLWNRREELGKYRSLEAFAITVTKNHCLDRLKSASYKYRADETGREVGKSPAPDKVLEVKEEVNRVMEAIKTLPEQQRIILHLRDVEGYDFPEIEEITGLTSNNVRVNLFRARKRVREIIIKEEQYVFSTNK